MARARFDSDEKWAWWVPSRQWARAWVDGARQYWALVIDDYRGRVTDYYHERYQDNPDAFWLMKPAHVVVAVCFIHI